MVKTLTIVLQQIKVDGYNTILVMRATQTFLNLLQHLVQQVHTQGCGAFAQLIKIGFLSEHRAYGFGVDGGGEMYLAEQLGELGAGSL